MKQTKLRDWLLLGTYPRFFLPIFLIIVATSLVRYSLLVDSEMGEAHARVDTEINRLGHFMLPLLIHARGPANATRVQELLDAETRFNPDIEALRWQLDGVQTDSVNQVRKQAEVPRWFSALAHTERLKKQFSETLADGQTAMLAVVIRPDASLLAVWKTVATQLRISLFNIAIIFILLTLLLRANARMLKRLSLATESFKADSLDTRMPVTGTLEARAVAKTFNGMASQIQALVKSLQETQRQQSEQLHFTRQLVDALPLPIFVRSEGGLCLSVNRAWEHLFDTREADLLGKPMPSDFLALPGERAGKGVVANVRRLPKQEREIRLMTALGESLDAAYFKASFTTIDGIPAGTISTLVDITERKQAQAALMAEKERAEVTLASIGDGVITTDLAGRIDSINAVARLLTGSTAEQAQGCRLPDIFRLDSEAGQWPSGNPVADIHTTDRVVHAASQILIHRSGKHYTIDFTAAPIRKSDGSAVGCVLVFRDVTPTRLLAQELSWQARHDVLTGLYNRAALAQRLTHALSLARQDQKLLAVCLLDLDHFQLVNDQHGNRVGDRLLKEVALRLQAFATDSDAIAHMGGDEFVVLLGDQLNLQTIEARVTQLLQRLAVPYAINGTMVAISVSAGVAVFPLDDVNPDTLLRHADQAMYQAKSTGRNRMHLFDAKLDREVQTHQVRQTRVFQALRDGELRLHYQPKVNMRSNAVYGMEALLRWQHPEQGLLGPAHFLDLVENTDLMVDIGEWVLQQALSQMKRWVELGYQWVVSVNIAARHFHRPDFVARLQEILSAYPEVSPTHLELEILESAALEDVNHMHWVMRSSQALGVRFALDDFGTGFSSLSYLKRLPAETIKIDQTFVRGILDDDDDLTLVIAIVALANAFHRQVIAEGVETVAHGQRLLQLGCELAQGAGIARSMPPQDVVRWAQNYRFFA